MGNARRCRLLLYALGGMSMKSVCRFLKLKRILGTASALAVTFAAAANAEEEKTRNFSIEAQPLAMALVEFSRQSDITVIAPSKTTRGLQSRAVVGEMEPAEALEALLGEADLELRTRRDRAIILAQVSKESGPIRETQIEEDAGSFAVAEDEEDVFQLLEEIVVTGTNIRGATNQTTPIFQFDREDIELSGAGTVEDFLRIIPQNFNQETSFTGQSGNPFRSFENAAGQTAVDLRGLGAGSTLTLLNGRRMSTSGFGSFVDVSVLPLGVVERVDVLTDGASAVYGSDAVGGVVNFITRKDYEGLDINARYGTVTDGSQNEFSVGGAGGIKWGSGGAFLGIEYLESDPLLLGERDFVDLDSSPGEADDPFGAQQERYSIAGSMNQEITGRLSVHVDALFTNRKTELGQVSNDRVIRSEQDALFINTRLDFEVSENIIVQTFFDYSTEDLLRRDNRNGPNDFGNEFPIDNEVMVAEAQISGIAMALPAGPLSFAVGGQYREESLDQPVNEFRAKRDINAVYGELLIPLIGEGFSLPLIKTMELSVAGRYEDYSDFGDTFNPKVGLFWELNDELSFRTSYSESFRAPDLQSLNNERFLIVRPASLSEFVAVDPPAQQDPRLPDGTRSLLYFSGGNPFLTEETAETWTAGLTYDPTFVPGLSFGLNYFSIEYTDRIESIGFTNPLQFAEFAALADTSPDLDELTAIFNQANADPNVTVFNFVPFFDPGTTFLNPGAEDIQVLLNTGNINIGERNVSGLDATLEYSADTRIGTFSATLNGAYLFDYESRLTEEFELNEEVDLLYRPVDLRLRGNVSWSKDGFTIFAALNYTDSYETSSDLAVSESIDSWTTLDVSLSYDTEQRLNNLFANNTIIGLSIQNILNEEPPFVETPFSLNYDPSNANPFGRFISVSVSKRF